MISSESKFPEGSFDKGYLKLGLIVLLLFFVLSVVVLSWVPPVGKDALTHHLAVPKLYLKHGGIYEIPGVLYSYYPMNLDLLYMVPLYFGNDIIPKFIHFAFALFTAFSIFIYLRRRIDTHFALVGAILFLSLPIVVKLSISAYVDLGLVFFSTASILFLLYWLEHQYPLRYLVIAGICCGLALGTKYNGLIIFLLLSFFVAFYYVRSAAEERSGIRQMKGIGYAILFVLISLSVFSPWMARNYVWTKNPVYPLYDQWFNPPQASPILQKGKKVESVSKGAPLRLDHFTKRRINYDETWWQSALVPVRIFFQGKDNDPRYFDGKLNPFLFFLPFLVFLKTRRITGVLKTETHFLSSFSVLYLGLVFFSSEMRIRWIAPIIPPLILLSVLGLHGLKTAIAARWSRNGEKIATGSVLILLGLYLALNTAYVVGQFRHVDPLSYITGGIGRDDYIERYWGEYPVVRYANATLPEHADILSLFLGNRFYYSDRKMNFNVWIFKTAVDKSKSPEEISKYLLKKGITHLLVRYDLFMIWSRINFSQDRKQVVEAFFKASARRLYSKNGYGLFELGSPYN
jgi:4-amino-4-deoxy-L-arabinose transferase-like glycosyltransferase